MITIQQVYDQVKINENDVLFNGIIICCFGHNGQFFTHVQAMSCHGWYVVNLGYEKLEIYHPDEGLGIILEIRENGNIDIEMY